MIFSEKTAAQYFSGGGTKENPYLISNRTELEYLATDVNNNIPYTGAHFLLTADIDLSATAWTPIGNKTSMFSGIFHGGNRRIRNISISTGAYIGLFGQIGNGAMIDSLHIVSGNITGDGTTEYAGALVGYVVRGSSDIVIRGCSNAATVDMSNGSSSNTLGGAGGLVGGCKVVMSSGEGNISLIGCTNNGKVTGKINTGGLVGYSESEGQTGGTAKFLLIACSNSGVVRGIGDHTGGLIGYCWNHVNNASTTASFSISSCTNFGAVTGEGKNTGGLIGSSSNNIGENGGNSTGSISDNYSHAVVKSIVSGDSYVGGLVGRLTSNHTGVSVSVENCYAIGKVTAASATDTVGGLVGAVSGAGSKAIRYTIAAQDSLIAAGATAIHRIIGDGTPILNYNYALDGLKKNGNPVTTGTLHDNNEGQSLSLPAIKTRNTYGGTFLPWDFSTLPVWTIRDYPKSYPYLAYQSEPAYIVDMAYGEAKLNFDHVDQVDSIVVTKGVNRDRIKAVQKEEISNKQTDNYVLVTIPCGDNAVANLTTGDTLNIVVYQNGKAASYPVSGTVKSFYGQGTAAAPYEIWSRADLERMKSYLNRNDLHFRLMKDIDMECSWEPMGNAAEPFRGKFHGGNHRIHRMKVEENVLAIGLFGVLGDGAFIDSLHIVGGSITGGATTQYAGALAGQAQGNVVIRACSNTASVTTEKTDAHTGGLIGSSDGGSGSVVITSAHNSGWVESKGANTYTGGLIGSAAASAIGNSYNFAWIRATGGSTVYAGGLAGELTGNSRIDSCYAAGTVKAPAGTVGGLAGQIAGSRITKSVAAQDTLTGLTGNVAHRIAGASSGTLTDNQAYQGLGVNGNIVTGSTVAANDIDGANKTLEDVKTEATYSSSPLSWAFNNIWTIRGNQKSYPYLSYQSAPAYINYLYRDSV
ncbi:MAG: hypothetical protein LBR08_13815, partial [Bacteroidales bacterium]|nr:hypothetical protein [Bacteroidales bacterium]